MSHSFSSRLSIAPDVLFRVVGQEVVLVNLKTQLYVGLEAVGARMWELLTDEPSIQAAYEALLEEYDVESARLRADLGEFLGTLLAQGVIQSCGVELAMHGQ